MNGTSRAGGIANGDVMTESPGMEALDVARDRRDCVKKINIEVS